MQHVIVLMGSHACPTHCKRTSSLTQGRGSSSESEDSEFGMWVVMYRGAICLAGGEGVSKGKDVI